MDQTFLIFSLSPLFLLLVLIFLKRTKSPKLNLPPCPHALPILGHLHLIKQPLHRTLNSISQKTGPVTILHFGTRRVLLVSSASAAEECLAKNDIVFANRPNLIIGQHLGHNFTTLVGASYGHHWRNLRRLSSLEIFSTTRLNKFAHIRRNENQLLIRSLLTSAGERFARVELKSKFSGLSFNVIMRMICGRRYYGEAEDTEEAKTFREIMKEMVRLADASNPADFFPILRWLDYGNLEERMKKLGAKNDAFLQGLIDEHRNGKSETKDTMVDHLLNLQKSEPEYYTDMIIKGLILVLLTAGSETTALTIEWAMTLLLNHPETLKKVRVEIDAQVGQDRLVDESDLSKLPSLQNVILETLRLCPPVPLLLAHYSSKECEVSGFDIPSGTILLVNAWTIHRDPDLWEDPTSFRPERDKQLQVNPIWVGEEELSWVRPTQRVVGLTLSTLIQCFEWKRIGEEKIDMTEGSGLTMPKVEPLVAICRARPVTKLVTAGAL
ncbi:Cytochrome P450 [Dillenia turbinata]|uniref:Cytochrome P450 n=1 Tax=Dillenia turbinata TaxID=194707 RepID=A0AAN8Z1M2_9MAGN